MSKLYARNLITINAGGIAAKHPDSDYLFITPTGVNGVTKADLKPRDVLKCDRSGKVIEGRLKPSSEIQLYLKILDLPNINAVIHATCPIAISLALAGVEIKPITPLQGESGLWNGVGIVPFSKELYDTTKYPRISPNLNLRDFTLKSLSNHKAVILVNHGTITVGENIDEAFYLTELLEETAIMIHTTHSYTKKFLDAYAILEK